EWQGEETSLTAGRFTADALRSVASFQDGTIDFASERGWARAPERAPILADSARPAGRKAEAERVRALARDADDSGAPFLCLSIAGAGPSPANAASTALLGAYRADGSYEAGISCGRHDAREGLWHYRARLQPTGAGSGANTGRFWIRGFDTNKTAFDRPFVDGRFSDMVATGGPIVTGDRRQGRILVPTRAGTTSLGANGEIIDAPLHRPSGAALSALFLAADGSVRVVTPNRVETLDGSPADGCPAASQALQALTGLAAQGAALNFLAISTTREGRMELVVRTNGSRLMMEQACSGETLPGSWRTIVDAGGRPRLKAIGDRWRGAAEIGFIWRNDRLTALQSGTPEVQALALLADVGVPLRLLHAGPNILLVTERDLYRVDLDRALSSLAR
ncbi:MAG: hypothetical protein NTV97_00800, partial [Alphaproteobacteria bacterium]|nr:hypothetical protein [Alphaproteobacteria bacterium]